MQIVPLSNTNFESKNIPIKPYTLKTKNGVLNISEVTKQELKSIKFFKEVIETFFKNLSKSSTDPLFKFYKTDHAKYIKRKPQLYMGYRKNLNKNLDSNPNRTFLVARDDKGHIQAICDTSENYWVPNTGNSLYVRNFVVNDEYKRQGVGKSMLETIINASKNSFENVYLHSTKGAIDFYKHLDFKELDKSNTTHNNILKYLKENSQEYQGGHIFPMIRETL